MREITDVLGKLADLKDKGALTDQEFNEQKQRLLGGR
ncbi:SHOCT domain-containing protein [Candidatus Mycobacterium wuenschmannii]|uniref:SHOCT domain-containing protein n=1 Tax=Candidatus Mycobacterium wuenschmannii TaxID=3027808 RepID=A0ABY8W3F7_9MYCO|nr:SHOCT domain-containing protein [Candidatus Mycobacterium wuenschmannii]WIM90438.1 SHOCT domain-containing protein [Candidatus Mycobacterium wuenschmannii]